MKTTLASFKFSNYINYVSEFLTRCALNQIKKGSTLVILCCGHKHIEYCIILLYNKAMYMYKACNASSFVCKQECCKTLFQEYDTIFLMFRYYNLILSPLFFKENGSRANQCKYECVSTGTKAK